ncbi:hypothetical protein KKY_1961 [Pelagibacterium halotolerans B2]|uniref:Uncharacterized protein n=1 Tax=Pelagibacterium halotolerans (strain DSM 22347 / JCM 15775 / CGMCC 1.7692 / B2) TaxID=1082931 RepID=G4RFD3_PELHB|nr:hypothetical protein KKY_1961 [Pelagibacterium halotolerans B2]
MVTDMGVLQSKTNMVWTKNGVHPLPLAAHGPYIERAGNGYGDKLPS